jgi:hypothetical protein
VASEAADQRESHTGGPPKHGAEHGTFDAWLIWSIAVIAIGLPVIFLICASSIPTDTIDNHDLTTAAGRGEFLVPVLILCAEAIRRWTREVKGGRLVTALKVCASVFCGLAGIVCMTAAIMSATTAATTQTASSLTAITVSGVIVGGVFGTFGVMARAGGIS